MEIAKRLGRKILVLGSDRNKEYDWARNFLKNYRIVIDVGCGTGTFLEFPEFDSIGVDVNPENIKYCLEKHLNAKPGNALNLPFRDSEFEAAHCSHLLQVFSSHDAVRLIQELNRVTCPGGRIVITTLNDFRSFYRHPENSRPYPPDSLRRLFGTQNFSQSPMFPDVPLLREVGIKLRHPALIEMRFSSSIRLGKFASVLNASQRIIGLRKWWRFDAYTICFEKDNSLT